MKNLTYARPQVNPMIWGGIAGIASGFIVILANALGYTFDSATALSSPFGAAMGGLFWGFMVANVRNWLARR